MSCFRVTVPLGFAFRARTLGWLAILLLLTAGARVAWATEIPWLLEPESNLPPDAARLASRPGEPGAGRRMRPARSVEPTAWRKGDRWRVPIGDAGTEVLNIDEVEPEGKGMVRVHGRLEGDRGSTALITVSEGVMAGVLRRGDGTRCIVVPDGDGLIQREVRDNVRCGNGSVTDEGPAQAVWNRRLASTSGVTTNILDLLLCHTAAAEEGAGGSAGIRALLELSVLEANDAFARSGIRIRLRVAGVVRVEYEESGDLAVDLARLTRSDDGWMDSVHGLRNEHAADLVCLVTESENSNQYAGMANQLRDLEASALARGFTVCLRPFLVGNYTLAHEIGHLLGGNHDRETTPEGGLRRFSYGTRFTAEGQVYRTVMAYRPGIQVPHFSNPDITFRGVPTGTRGTADNAATLNEVAPWLAAVRDPMVRVTFARASNAVGEQAGFCRLVLERSGGGGPGTVRVRTLDGTARAGVDYEALDRWIAFPAGSSSAEVEIPIHDTGTAEGARRFSVSLSEPSAGWGIGPESAAFVDILDDEVPAGGLLDSSFRSRTGADQVVSSLVRLPAGGWMVGGGFVTFNGQERARLARVGPDGGLEAGFVSKVKYRVNAILALADGRVVIGGDFNTVNDVRLNHVAVLQEDGRLDPGFEFEVGTDLAVNALALAPGGGVILGGRFTSIQGVAALRVARVNLAGVVDTTFDARTAADGEVHALVVDAKGRVVIGGRFGRVGGQVRGGVARLDDRGTLDAGFAAGAGANGAVLAVAEGSEGRVYVGGEFTSFHGRPAGRVVRLTESGGLDEDFAAGTGADDAVLAILPRPDGSVWIAGKFVRVQGKLRSRVARLMENGELDGAFDPGAGPNDWVLAVAEREDGCLMMAGAFSEVSGVPRGGVAALFPVAMPPPRLKWMSPAGLDFEWAGIGWPRQEYVVEESSDLSHWAARGVVSAADGRLWGRVPRYGGEARFVRLRRILE